MDARKAYEKSPNLVLCEMGETRFERLESHSPFCLKIHRALRATRLSYTSRRGAPRDFRHLNPAGQVPVLLVDDEAISDSTRILARIVDLAAISGKPNLVPHDARTRAEAWLWEDWADRALSGYVVAARWAEARNWPLVRDAYFEGAPWFVRTLIAPQIRRRVLSSLIARDVLRGGRDALWDDYRRILDCLEARAPARGFWITSDTVTIADIALFAPLASLRTPLTAAQSREIALRPALTDWLDRVDEATFAGPRSAPDVTPRAESKLVSVA